MSLSEYNIFKYFISFNTDSDIHKNLKRVLFMNILLYLNNVYVYKIVQMIRMGKVNILTV